MTPIQGILFDKDGTLFDFAATWEAWAASFLLRLGGTPERAQVLGQTIGFDHAARRFARDSLVIAGTAGEVADALLPHISSLSRDGLLALIDEEAKLAPQAEAVPLHPYLSDLRRRGLRLGVATNDSEAPARAHLDKAGVTALFDFIAGYDSGHGAKPGPGQMLAFAEAVGLAPEAVVMVGDSTHDLIAGRAAGMRCVAVLTGIAGREVLAPLADAVLDDIGGLPEWIAAQQA